MTTSADYTTVTELPGSGATREQLSMLVTRYRLARDMTDGKDVLEVGCGPGIGLGYLAQKARRVVGGDYDAKLVDLGKKHYGDRVEMQQLDAENLPFAAASFDAVLLLEAIYYLPNAEKFLQEARRVLRDDGVLLICSANPAWPGFNPSPYSNKYYTATELQELLEQVGFTTTLLVGFQVSKSGLRSKVLGIVRRLAVRLRLIPKTMRGKGLLKRLLFGRLTPLPAELSEDTAAPATLVSVGPSTPLHDYKVVYAIGRLG